MSDQDWPHFTEGACHTPDKKPQASDGNVEAYDVDADAPTYRNGVSMDQNQPPATSECLHIASRNERAGDRWQCTQCGKSFDDRDKSAPQFGEPWTYHEFNGNRYVVDGMGVLILRKDMPSGYPDLVKNAIYLERATQTVNAMANIPDPQGFVREVRELLHRCEGFVDWYNEAPDHPVGAPLLKDIRAMLARLDALK